MIFIRTSTINFLNVYIRILLLSFHKQTKCNNIDFPKQQQYNNQKNQNLNLKIPTGNTRVAFPFK